jgi:hypothetical protein
MKRRDQARVPRVCVEEGELVVYTAPVMTLRGDDCAGSRQLGANFERIDRSGEHYVFPYPDDDRIRHARNTSPQVPRHNTSTLCHSKVLSNMMDSSIGTPLLPLDALFGCVAECFVAPFVELFDVARRR